MPAHTEQAIVLRLSDYSETSQIATLLTAGQGLVRLIAKGARRSTAKKPSVGLDLLELGEASYLPARGEAGLGTLTEWVQRETFRGMRRGLSRLYGGLYAAELVTALTQEYDPHPGMFEALHELLSDLSGDAEPVVSVSRFASQFATAIGYAPRLDRCVTCRRVRPAGRAAFFSSRAGGLLCRDCEMHFAEKRRVPGWVLDEPVDERGDEPGDERSTPATGASDAKGRVSVRHEHSLRQRAFERLRLMDYHLTHVAGRAMEMSRQLQGVLAKCEKRVAKSE